MNYLEKIASEVKSTPQVLWFKKRYTPLMSTFLKLVEDGVIKYSGSLDDILIHDNELTKLGIDIPIMMDMSLKLQFYDLLDKVILNAEEMVDELWD